MASKKFITEYGKVKVCNAMLEDDNNNTDLYEGIEIKLENGELLEIFGYHDVDELSVDDVEAFIENY